MKLLARPITRGNFHNTCTSPNSLIKSYAFYFRARKIFAKSAISQKCENNPHAKTFTSKISLMFYFRMTQLFPLKCDAPVDFEYQLIYTQPHPSFTVHPMTGKHIVLTTPLIYCASNDRWANCFDHSPHSLCIQWQVSTLFWPHPSFTVHPMTGEQIVMTTPLIYCASNDRWANCFDHTPHLLCIQWQVSKLFWPLPSFTVHPMTGKHIVLTTPLIYCASNDRWANCYDHTPHLLCIQWQVSKLFWPHPSFSVHPMAQKIRGTSSGLSLWFHTVDGFIFVGTNFRGLNKIDTFVGFKIGGHSIFLHNL